MCSLQQVACIDWEGANATRNQSKGSKLQQVADERLPALPQHGRFDPFAFRGRSDTVPRVRKMLFMTLALKADASAATFRGLHLVAMHEAQITTHGVVSV